MKGVLALVGLQFIASTAAYLATTTRYYDGQEGACGCGTSSGLDSWQLGITTGVYTAAGSQAFFDTDGASWCGAGCGKCYNLTSTGSSACDGCGTGGVSGESIIVMVTNLCPYNGNEKWCPQVGSENDYGYSYHFDIMAESEVFGDNVVVDFEPVACPGQAASDWESCICYGQTETDTTPAGMSSADSSRSSSTSSSTTTTSKATSTTTTTTTTTISVATTLATAKATTVAKEEETATSAAPSLATTKATSTTTGEGTSTANAPSATQSLYGQCGGINWTGATACATGSTCTVMNPWYYQCVE